MCALLTEPPERGPSILMTDHVVAVVPERMRTWGAVVIAPRRHVRNASELTDDEARDTALVLRRVLVAIESALDPDGVNVWWATGVLADQPIEHLLVEAVPRWEGTPYQYAAWSAIPSARLSRRTELASLLRARLA